jgi:hypothetical protein
MTAGGSIMVSPRLLFVFAALLLAAAPAVAADGYFPANRTEARFCAGLERDYRPGNAARLACESPTDAIVVEYQDYWREAIGQALSLAAETDRRPGIVLVCRNDEQHCMAASTGVRAPFSRYAVPLTLWDCGLMDQALGDCTRHDCGPSGCS